MSYSLASEWGADTFTLEPTTGVLALSAGAALDFESVQQYVLVVSASDGGSPALSATATVYVNVLDVNDNPPRVERTVYEVTVAEDAPVGHNLVDIVAHDPDEGRRLFHFAT